MMGTQNPPSASPPRAGLPHSGRGKRAEARCTVRSDVKKADASIVTRIASTP